MSSQTTSTTGWSSAPCTAPAVSFTPQAAVLAHLAKLPVVHAVRFAMHSATWARAAADRLHEHDQHGAADQLLAV